MCEPGAFVRGTPHLAQWMGATRWIRAEGFVFATEGGSGASTMAAATATWEEGFVSATEAGSGA